MKGHKWADNCGIRRHPAQRGSLPPVCRRCGLVALKNAVSVAAARAACPADQED